MPMFDADAMFPPIEIKLGGKVYKVETVTQKTLDALADSGKKKGDPASPEDANVLASQVAKILGIEPKELVDVDIRKLAQVSRHLMNTINTGMAGEGNAGGESVAKVSEK